MEYSTETQSFTDRLRTETAAAHLQLEELPLSKKIISPDISMEEYSAYLTLMHDVVKDTENNIAPLAADAITDLDIRRKTHLLEADLQHLGAIKSEYTRPLSSATDITAAFALGILYVVEGSSLGGRVILKNITPALGFDENGGAKYFSGYGSVTGSTWRNFIMMMDAYALKTNSADEIIAGANFAFSAIKKHLEQNSAA